MGQVGTGREGILFSATAREGLEVGWARFDRQRAVCLGPLTDKSLVKRAGKGPEEGEKSNHTKDRGCSSLGSTQ